MIPNPPQRKPRLAILITSFRGGGAERVVSLLWPRLSADFDVYVALLSDEGNRFDLPPADRTLVLDGETRDWRNIVRLPALARRYRDFLDRHAIDASLSFLNRPNFINALVRRNGWPGKAILSERAVTSLFYRTGLKRVVGSYLIRTLYRHADAIIPISKGVEHDLRTTYGVAGHYHTIYNPIDTAQVRADYDRAPVRPAGQPFTFVCVARFDPQKNHALLVNAFSGLHDAGARLLLVGDGPELERVRATVVARGLEARVTFLGYQRDPTRALKQADCFVLASDFEGLGNVLLEALACSLPIICTDCFSGPREILAPASDYTRQLSGDIEIAEYGILTPVGNAACLADAMRRIADDAELRRRFAEKAFARARRFDVERISAEYGATIARVVAGAPLSPS